MLKQRRVVITGLGAITPVGIGKESFWSALLAGVSGIRPLTRFNPAPFPVKVAGEIRGFDPAHFMDAGDVRRLPLFAQYAVAAARMALEDARLKTTASVGACFASSAAGASEWIREDAVVFGNAVFGSTAYGNAGTADLERYSPAVLHTGAATAAVCAALDLHGPRMSMGSGCSSGLDVVEWARGRIAAGQARVMVVGASDSPLFPYPFGALCATRALSPSAPCPRPFDRRHDGLAVSEAGAALVVEDLEHALERGAEIYAEVVGYGSAGDGAPARNGPAAEDRLAIEDRLAAGDGPGIGDRLAAGDGPGIGQALAAGDRRASGNLAAAAANAMQAAVRDAGLHVREIDAVSPFAPGVPRLDVADARAVKAVLGQHAYHVPAPAIQSCIGYAVAAAGVMQVAAMALAVQRQQIPPTINFEKPARDCDLDFVPGRGRYSRLRSVLVCSRSLSHGYSALVMAARADV